MDLTYQGERPSLVMSCAYQLHSYHVVFTLKKYNKFVPSKENLKVSGQDKPFYQMGLSCRTGQNRDKVSSTSRVAAF
jgi:hypothetical protein